MAGYGRKKNSGGKMRHARGRSQSGGMAGGKKKGDKGDSFSKAAKKRMKKISRKKMDKYF